MNLLFLSIFSSILKRAVVGNSKSFTNLISQTPYSLVLFKTSGCGECKQLVTVLDQITDKYSGKISMIIVDSEVSSDISKKYSVTDIPSIGVFGSGKFIRFYQGEWTEIRIIEFCDNLLSQKPDLLNDIFDVYNFQTKHPANLIIFDPNQADIGYTLLRQFAGRLQIGILKNESHKHSIEISSQFDKPESDQKESIQNGVALLTRPSDGFSTIVDNLDFDSLDKIVNPMIVRIENQETFGKSSQTNHTLVAYVDERDPLQLYDIQNLFHNISKNYDGKILSYQYCDFYRCTSAAKQLGITNYGNPVFVLSLKPGSNVNKKADNGQYQLFADPSPSSEELIDWLDSYLNDDQSSSSINKQKNIPELLARNFVQVALDPKNDVIILLTAPGMQKSKEANENMLHLIDIFRPFKKHIQFYQFNPNSQHIPGLQFPRSDIPQISVWAAEGGQNGATFSAVMPFRSIINNLMQLIKTKISPAHIRDITSRAQEISEKQNVEKPL